MIVKQSSGLLIARATTVCLVAVTDVILARFLDVQQFGEYRLVIAWISAGALLSNYGFSSAATRFGAKYAATGDGVIVRRVGKWAIKNAATIGIAVAAAIVAASFGLYREQSSLVTTFIAGAVGVPLLAVAQVGDGLLRGLGKVLRGQVPITVGRRCLLLVGIAAIWGFSPSYGTSATVAALHTVAIASCGIVILWYLQIATASTDSRKSTSSMAAADERGRWIEYAIHAGTVGVVINLFFRLDTIILGLFNAPSAVAHYSVGSRVASGIAMLLAVSEVVLSPKISELSTLEQSARLQEKVSRVTSYAAAGAVALGIVIIIFNSAILRIFGAQYTAAQTVVTVLVVTHVGNVIAGPSTSLLTMSGNERIAVFVCLPALALNVAGNFVLVPIYGAEGAALATGATLILWKGVQSIVAQRVTGIASSPIEALK